MVRGTVHACRQDTEYNLRRKHLHRLYGVEAAPSSIQRLLWGLGVGAGTGGWILGTGECCVCV